MTTLSHKLRIEYRLKKNQMLTEKDGFYRNRIKVNSDNINKDHVKIFYDDEDFYFIKVALIHTYDEDTMD